MSAKSRIFLTGVGGQGTLTATTILARAALDAGLPVTAGEIHGMAQRGGVVESAVLTGGYATPKIARGEADVLLGFEPLETLRGLAYLKPGGAVFSSTAPLPPPGVNQGRDAYPEQDLVTSRTRECASLSWFIDCRSIAREAGNERAANIVLLGAACASGLVPITLDTLLATIESQMKPKLVAVNIQAARRGAQALEG